MRRALIKDLLILLIAWEENDEVDSRGMAENEEIDPMITLVRLYVFFFNTMVLKYMPDF